MLNLNTIKVNKLLAYTFTTFSFIIPGAGSLYLINHDLFKELPTIQLIILSIFLSLPIFMIGLTSIGLIWNYLPKKE